MIDTRVLAQYSIDIESYDIVSNPNYSRKVVMNHSYGYDLYRPIIWFKGDNLYATCHYLEPKTFSDTSVNGRLTFENRLWRALKDDWGVLAQTLTLKYQKGCALVIFQDPEELVMAKMTNGQLRANE